MTTLFLVILFFYARWPTSSLLPSDKPGKFHASWVLPVAVIVGLAIMTSPLLLIRWVADPSDKCDNDEIAPSAGHQAEAEFAEVHMVAESGDTNLDIQDDPDPTPEPVASECVIEVGAQHATVSAQRLRCQMSQPRIQHILVT